MEQRGREKHPLARDKETNGDLSMWNMEGGQNTHILETRKQIDV